MMLAFIECKNGLHEPTADTAEEPKPIFRQRRRLVVESTHIRRFARTMTGGSA